MNQVREGGSEPGAFARRRQARNWAILIALIVVMLLFYAITIVKLTKA